MSVEAAIPSICSLAAGARHALPSSHRLPMRSLPPAATALRIAGSLFGISWLLWMDGVAIVSSEFDRSVSGAHYVPGIMQTLSLVMLNTVNWESIIDSDGLSGEGGSRLAKAWVFVALCCAFGGLIGSIWILAEESLRPSWPGSFDPALKGVLQNVCCFVASLLFRVSRLKSDT